MQEVSQPKFTKNGRELQELLGSTKDHTSWSKVQISYLTLLGEIDYQVVTEQGLNPHAPKNTYWFTEAAAYRIAATIGKTSQPEKAQMVKENMAMKSMTLERVFADPECWRS